METDNHQKECFMKKTLKPIGIIVMFAVIVVLMTSASVWDSKTPKADRVSLYYPDDFSVESVNGESKKMGPIIRYYAGKGKMEKGKLSLVIPPGQTTLGITHTTGISTSNTEVSYNFLPGGHYRLIPSLKDGITFGDLMKGAFAGQGNIWDWKIDKIK
jgi:hypothetical protein